MEKLSDNLQKIKKNRQLYHRRIRIGSFEQSDKNVCSEISFEVSLTNNGFVHIKLDILMQFFLVRQKGNKQSFEFCRNRIWLFS